MSASHRPRKRFGQNFLQDQAIIDQIVGALNLKQSSAVLEIGPGQGALTQKILQRRETDTHLTVVEVDRDLVAALREKAPRYENYEIVEGDVLKIDLESLRSAQSGCLNICGNLPYNISTPLLFKLLEAQVARRLATVGEQQPDSEDNEGQLNSRDFASGMVFMLQKEVVDRLCARAGSKAYGRLSVVVQSVFQADCLFDVPPESFYPPPKVMSAVVRLSPKAQMAVDAASFAVFQKFVAKAFSQKRKTIKNNVKGLLTAPDLEAAGIDPAARPETLRVEAFVALSQTLDSSNF